MTCAGAAVTLSCPGRVQRALSRERNESRDPAQYREAPYCSDPRVAPGSRVSLRSPGTRARGGARSEPLAVILTHDVKQRSVVRSRGALLRPGFACFSSHPLRFAGHPPSPNFGAQASRPLSASATTNSRTPMRGGWSADRRTHSFGRACEARPPCPGATGTSLGAPPWRFSDADPRSRLPAVEPEPQRLPAPSIRAWRSGSGPPALRFAPQRGTPLLAPSFRIVSRKRPSEPGCKSCITNSIRSQ